MADKKLSSVSDATSVASLLGISGEGVVKITPDQLSEQMRQLPFRGTFSNLNIENFASGWWRYSDASAGRPENGKYGMLLNLVVNDQVQLSWQGSNVWHFQLALSTSNTINYRYAVIANNGGGTSDIQFQEWKTVQFTT